MRSSHTGSVENLDVTCVAEVLCEALFFLRHVLKQLVFPEMFSFLLTLAWTKGEPGFGEKHGVEARFPALREEHDRFNPNLLII